MKNLGSLGAKMVEKVAKHALPKSFIRRDYKLFVMYVMGGSRHDEITASLNLESHAADVAKGMGLPKDMGVISSKYLGVAGIFIPWGVKVPLFTGAPNGPGDSHGAEEASISEEDMAAMRAQFGALKDGMREAFNTGMNEEEGAETEEGAESGEEIDNIVPDSEQEL